LRGHTLKMPLTVNLRDGVQAFDVSLRPVRNARGEVRGVVPEAVPRTLGTPGGAEPIVLADVSVPAAPLQTSAAPQSRTAAGP
jgi:hypothetical protein